MHVFLVCHLFASHLMVFFTFGICLLCDVQLMLSIVGSKEDFLQLTINK